MLTDIVAQVRASLKPPFRPSIPANACINAWRTLVEDCWQEAELRRPSFQRIRTILREINGGRSIDVIENIIRMLEQHTEHLEEIMADRINDVQKEKKKVTVLLNSILPK